MRRSVSEFGEHHATLSPDGRYKSPTLDGPERHYAVSPDGERFVMLRDVNTGFWPYPFQGRAQLVRRARAPRTSAEIGQTLSHYEITDKLGSSGMSDVYRNCLV